MTQSMTIGVFYTDLTSFKADCYISTECNAKLSTFDYYDGWGIGAYL